MQRRNRRIVIKCLGAAAFAPAFGVLHAQGVFPNRPIKIIAPVQPGGGVDLVARTVGDRLARALGQPVIVDQIND